jgi:molecular chaperone GrpE
MKRNSKDFTDNQHNDTPTQETPAEELHLENPDVEAVDVDPEEDGMAEVAEETSELESLRALLQTKEEEVAKEKKEYMFLMAEFDNFRKRTLRERSELIKNASEKALQGILPIVDDFERGLDAIKDSSDAEAVKEGMALIYNKLVKYLGDNGVKAMESTGADFDPDLHEAVAMVPADADTTAGKVKDTVQKGYTLNDKVLRHAKVVVAQ